MTHRNVLRPDTACLLVIDMQEKFAPAIQSFDAVAGSAAKLMTACRALGVPVIATEQYPRGLGRTIAPIRDLLGGNAPLEKTAFSCTGAEGFAERLQETGADTVVVCGIETHVCVNQTVHALLDQGLCVHVVADAVGSRHAGDHDVALRKMDLAGAVLATVEMSLFELLGDAGHERFREIQKLVK
ncbi:MAG: isochorismatase family protein [Chitinivibrionales bacterium]|nr:isochorismatase family protein [Chitinivibrionales bacterium]MBD3395612.1 isochorismatase family protein [Chitinivibrionales bacterium]